MYKKGIFIGRFQPFHYGHLKALELITRMCEEIIIGIGSANTTGTARNPLDVNERQEIISTVLVKRQLEANIYSIEDIPDDKRWMDYVLRCDFDAIFSSNQWVLDIAKSVKDESGYDYAIIDVKPLVDSGDTKDISATKVRASIKDDDGQWKSMIPEEIIPIIEGRFHDRFRKID